ncbi:hypothetical protein D3C87_1716180 [compost metagenome]
MTEHRDVNVLLDYRLQLLVDRKQPVGQQELEIHKKSHSQRLLAFAKVQIRKFEIGDYVKLIVGDTVRLPVRQGKGLKTNSQTACESYWRILPGIV